MKIRQSNRTTLQKAISMYRNGYNNREISAKLNITEKTIGKWLLPFAEAIRRDKETIDNLSAKINLLSKDANVDASEISKIASAISVLNKKIYC